MKKMVKSIGTVLTRQIFQFDALSRPTSRTTSRTGSQPVQSSFSYNERSEVLAAATLGTNLYGYAYDTIGNRQWSAANSATNEYSANCLNQYTMMERTAPGAPPAELYYDADGNLEWDDSFAYSYDAENRLTMVSPVYETNGVVRVINAYDRRNRRVRKTVQRLACTVAPAPSPPIETRVWNTVETHTFVWDANNIVLEKVEFATGTTRMFEYFWGLDKSGTEQGAGGVGGLFAMSVDGEFYIPCYDHNGNIVLYISETGSIAAQYTYDPYGNIIESSGPLADVFSFGFCTKCHDREIGMVGYQQRVYRPDLGRWLNRDPIEEEGGENLYAFVRNSPGFYYDYLGLVKFFAVNNSPRYSAASDFWFAIFVEFLKGEGGGNLIVRRTIDIDLCPCSGGKKIVKKSSVISSVHIEADLSSDQMFPMMIHAKKTARTYVEIASLPAYGSGYKGTIRINVSLGYTKGNILFSKKGDSQLFGSNDAKHNLGVYDDDGRNIPLQSSATYNAVLTYSCANGDPELTSSSRTGNWGEIDNDRMKGDVTRTEDEIHNGIRSQPYE